MGNIPLLIAPCRQLNRTHYLGIGWMMLQRIYIAGPQSIAANWSMVRYIFPADLRNECNSVSVHFSIQARQCQIPFCVLSIWQNSALARFSVTCLCGATPDFVKRGALMPANSVLIWKESRFFSKLKVCAPLLTYPTLKKPSSPAGARTPNWVPYRITVSCEG